MRMVHMTSALLGAFATGGLLIVPAHATETGPMSGFVLAAESSSTTNDKDNVQGTAPHTGTDLGEQTPPAEKLGSQRPATVPGVQGTAPHTGTDLGQGTQPPAQIPGKVAEPMPNKSMGETSEGNAGKREKKMGEKPAP